MNHQAPPKQRQDRRAKSKRNTWSKPNISSQRLPTAANGENIQLAPEQSLNMAEITQMDTDTCRKSEFEIGVRPGSGR
jgi:hypothetical protein